MKSIGRFWKARNNSEKHRKPFKCTGQFWRAPDNFERHKTILRGTIQPWKHEEMHGISLKRTWQFWKVLKIGNSTGQKLQDTGQNSGNIQFSFIYLEMCGCGRASWKNWIHEHSFWHVLPKQNTHWDCSVCHAPVFSNWIHNRFICRNTSFRHEYLFVFTQDLLYTWIRLITREHFLLQARICLTHFLLSSHEYIFYLCTQRF